MNHSEVVLPRSGEHKPHRHSGTCGSSGEWRQGRISEFSGRSLAHQIRYNFPNLCIALFGVEQVMLALMGSLDKCRAIIERWVHRKAEHGISHIVNGADAIVVSSPFVGQSLISKAAYREFELPYLKRLIDGLRQYRPGEPIYVHSCGFLGDRLEDAVESGTDGMECLGPPPLGNVELEDAKRRIGGRVFIKGNIDSVNTLLFKSGEGVVQDIRQCIEACMPGGRYILSTACSVAPDVPPSR